jgi:ATP-dependent helicase/DNAse subunit B
MALTLVLGPANAAKAGEVLGAYQLAAARGALLVVPTTADAEHYDLELTERGVMLGRTLTFPRLLEEIAGRAGFEQSKLTALQKDRLLRRVISDLELPSMARSATALGFARAAGHLIAELQQARASAGRFISALSSWSAEHPERHQYARDLGAIYGRYADELRRRGVLDAEGFAWAALDALRLRPERWHATPVYFYGFDDLTPIELDTITTLSDVAGAPVTVSLTYESDRPALAARAGVVEELRGRAASVRQLPALDDYYAPAARAALHHLERHLFETTPTALDPGDAVVLLEAGGERAEAELVADEVMTALAAGVEPVDVVVICRALPRSAQVLERALARREIAATSARRVPLAHTSLGRALLGLATCAFTPAAAGVEDLLAYLRAPGIVADLAMLDAFEARARQTGIAQLSELRALRGASELPLADIDDLRRGGDPAAALAGAARRLLAAPHHQTAAVLTRGEQLDARAAATVLDALAQAAGIDETAEAILDLLAGLEVPAGGQPDAGAVLIAEPLAIRARRFRRVIVTGLCEGEFPSAGAVSGDPFLGEDGRRELALASGLALPTDEDPLARERYLLYACLSRATERVAVSYRSSDEDGNLVMPSPFMSDLDELFGTPWRERRRRRLLGDLDTHLPPAGDSAPGWEEVTGAGSTRTLGDAALAHVRHTRVVSGGALEAFAACPVRWLVESQLNPDELRPEAEPLAKGSFMHQVLERVIAGLEGPLTAATLPHAQALMEAEVAAPGVDFAPGRRPEIRAALLRGIEADLRRYLRHEAVSGNGWTPTHVELRFGLGEEEGERPGLTLGNDEDGRGVILRGVIDRVDVEPGSGRAIVRDYKSGAKQPDWAGQRWLDGHKFQVALYMLVVSRLLALEPVAGFYNPLTGGDLRPRGVYTAGIDAGAGTFEGDRFSAAELADLLEEIEQQAVELAQRLRRGELTPCPETCSGQTGGGCRHPGICWADS